MKDGYSRATGHTWERRYSDHDNKVTERMEWDDNKKEWIAGRRKYPYCLDCKQFGWGADPKCPENIEVVMVQELRVKAKT